MTTRAGVKAISSLGSALASQRASFSTSAAWTEPLPSVRSRFSSSTLRLKGSRATSYFDCSASRRKIVCSRSPTFRVSLASNEFGCSGMVRVLSGVVGEQHEGFPAGRGHRSEVLVDGRDAVACAAARRARRARRRSGRAKGCRRAIASVSSSASAHQRTQVGAGVEVAATAPRAPGRRRVARRGSPSRPPRAASPRDPRRPSRSSRRRAGDRGRPRRTARRRRCVSRTTVNPRRSPSIILSQSRRTLRPSVLRKTPTCGFGRRGFCIARASVRRMNSAFVRPSSAARRARASSRSGSR